MPSTESPPRRIDRVLRIAETVTLVALGAFCVLLLSIRFVVFPQVEAHRTDIANWLSARIGQPVEIDAVRTGWDGWNPKLSIRGFRVRDRNEAAPPLLDLPRVDLVIAWTSLPFLSLHLKELLIDSPRLWVRRDLQGRIHVAGVEVDTDSPANDSAFAEWLLAQPRVVVRDALLVWNDDYRNAPQLILDHVQFRLERRFGHRRIGLTGVPPAELAAPIDLRADITGGSLKDWKSLDGRVYLRLDYADVAAWGNWLPLPVPVERGKGALRMWVDVKDSQPAGVVADLELTDVQTTLEKGLPPLALSHLAGRARWKLSGTRTVVSAQGLSFVLPDGSAVAPANFTLTLDSPQARGGPRGRVQLDRLDLAPFVAIAGQVPLPAALRRDLARFDPRGTLSAATIAWTGPIDAPSTYRGSGRFDGVGFAAQDALPGASGASGSVDFDQQRGDVKLASRGLTIALPRVLAEPLAFDSLQGDVGWDRSAGSLRVAVKDLAFANARVAGTAAGTWRAKEGGPGEVAVTAQLTRLNLADTWRYVPLGADASLRDWAQRAITKGACSDAKLTLVGDLAQFPFIGGKGGQLVVAAKAQAVTLDYTDGWPAITGLDADLRYEAGRLSVAVSRGSVSNARIGATRAEIADVWSAQPVLSIDGEVGGPTSAFLDFIAHSPVAGWISHATDEAAATGDGRLALKLDLPLGDPTGTKLAGSYQLTGNTIRFTGVPLLAAVNGTLAFTQDGVHSRDLVAQVVGGPAKLQIDSGAGSVVRVSATGTAQLRDLRAQFTSPLLDRVHGSTDWQLALSARDGVPAWSIDSTLQGAAIDLPAPLRKAADATAALHIDRRALDATTDRITVDYAHSLRLLVHRRETAQGVVADRALILLGKAATEPATPERPGLWVRGDVASVDVDDWLDLGTVGAAGPGGDALALQGVDLDAGKLSVFGRKFTQVDAMARREGADWRLKLDGEGLAGTAVWHGATSDQPNGRLVARLARLSLPPQLPEGRGKGSAAAGAASDAPVQAAESANRWPEVDLVADAFSSKGHALGALELVADPTGPDWRIRKLSLANESGRIDAHGWWRNVAGRSQTHVNVAVDVKEAGAFLAHFGWPSVVKGAATRIDGEVAWDGAPSAFDYPTLSGAFKLKSERGQFTKIEPGVGRLLGVLSLQALPRRITLDFRDVFSEGFAFDSVIGDVHMQNGIMHTDDLKLTGPSAIVDIAGDADLAHETQQLKVRVQPSLSSGLSAGAAALFLANPLVGAAVGAGTLLAQKMLNNPFDQLFSYEYQVSGAWDDPVVVRVGASAATPPVPGR
ncbi:MAG: YhdP family protein [Betaproteobacteria bacterium]